MRKLIFYVLSFFISFAILYLLLFSYFFFTFEKDFKYNFQSLENLNFYKKYSKKVHHLIRFEPSDINSVDKKKQLFSSLVTFLPPLPKKNVFSFFCQHEKTARQNLIPHTS